MSIKQSMALIFLLLGVSFNAFADEYFEVNGWATGNVKECVGGKSGGKYSMAGVNALAKCVDGKYWYYPYTILSGCHYYEPNTGIRCNAVGERKPPTVLTFFKKSCPEDHIFNEISGECEEIPPPNYCDSPDFISMKESEEQNCDGEFTFTCVDSHNFSFSCDAPSDDFCTSQTWLDLVASEQASCDGKLEHSCTDKDNYSLNCNTDPLPPEQCAPGSPTYPDCCDESNNFCDVPKCEIGSPNWPDCSDLPKPPVIEPLPPIDPPTPNPSDPTTPNPVEPPDGDDNGSNADVIKSITGLNEDLNDLFAKSLDKLKKMNEFAEINNSLLHSQIEQDSKIFDKTKQVIDGQTGQLLGGLGDLGEMLSNKLGDLNNGSNTSVSSGSCDSDSFQCSGNAYECYMAKRAWEASCEGSKFNGSYGDGSLITFDRNFIFNQEAFDAAQLNIDDLKTEYSGLTNEFKTMMGINIGDFQNGSAVSHSLKLEINGRIHEFKSAVLPAFVEHAHLISAVLLFVMVMFGLRAF